MEVFLSSTTLGTHDISGRFRIQEMRLQSTDVPAIGDFQGISMGCFCCNLSRENYMSYGLGIKKIL